MALKQSVLNALLKQIPNVPANLLPSIEDQKAFIAAQIEGTAKAAYRTTVDIEVAKTLAASKDEASNQAAQRHLEDAAATLKALVPTLETLQDVATELEAKSPTIVE